MAILSTAPPPPRIVAQYIGKTPIVVGTTDDRLYDKSIGLTLRT